MGKRRRKAEREVSAGGIVFRRLEDQSVRFLLIRDPYQHWGFPKGHIEKGEVAQAAAIREVAEETGVADVNVRAPMQPIHWTFQWRGARIHKTCHYFLMLTAVEETCPQADEGITDCRWAPVEDALRLIRYPNARDLLRQADDLAAGMTDALAGGALRA